ncbi:Lin1244/Lin1753 domain-containing protein [Bacteroides clarus]|uniref:Lin1244/Lin1753 domain-containing protein n=1 Tax=Bacteroides clarus TaxID=626929 RepID=UPI0039788C71
MKNYFPHDSDARSDDKIIALRIKHKWEGYGLYWALIEKLRDSKDYTLKVDYNVLAFDLRSDAALIKSIINDFGLFAFTDDGECFYSKSLNMRMKPLDDKRAKLSDAGKRGNERRWKSSQHVSPPDNNLIAPQSPPNHPPIAYPSQEENRLEESKEEDNIPPTPPKGGGKKGKSEPKEINSKARLLFEQHFRETFGANYYWTAKDAGAMSGLLKKLKFQREQKQLDTSDENVLYALHYLLSSVREGWIFDNFSVTNINSKFNEIVAQAKNGNNRKPDTEPDKSSAGIKSIVFGKQS